MPKNPEHNDGQPSGMPVIGNPAVYHQNLKAIDELVMDLQEYEALLTPQHKVSLRKLLGQQKAEELTVDEVSKQYLLVKKIRDQIVDPAGTLLDGVEVRVIAALVSSISSLVSLFLKNQDKIDHLKEVSDLKEAVIEVVSTLDKPTQALFFAKLDAIKSRN